MNDVYTRQISKKAKRHMYWPENGQLACGIAAGPVTTEPEKVTCKRCLALLIKASSEYSGRIK